MEVIGQFGQGIVGLTLIIIGALGFWEIGGHRTSHSHSHSHSHPHSHSHGTDTPVKRDSSFISWTYITGTIHGLQPIHYFSSYPRWHFPRRSHFILGDVLHWNYHLHGHVHILHWCGGGCAREE